jgi:hypothetical protein
MPSVNDMYPDEWLKARHLVDGDETYTIVKDGETTFKDQKTGKDVHQIVLYFEETDLKLGLNKGNAATLAEVLDSGQSEDWIGKKVVVGCATSNSGIDYVQVRKHPTKASNRARAGAARRPLGTPEKAVAAAPARVRNEPVTQAEIDAAVADTGDDDADIPF